MNIQWISCPERDVIFLSAKFIQDFKINCEKLTLHFGAWEKKLSVKVHDEIDENTIGLSNNLNGACTIPDTLPYDMHLSGEHLHLGPVIAFFVGKGYLSKEKRGKWRAYCRNYAQIRGLVYFCTVEGIEKNTKTIEGYYYDPSAEATEQLKFGKFPYPGVVYRRARFPQDILRDLYTHVEGRIFNAYIFDKWEMWTVLSKAGFAHTPYTEMFNGFDSLKKMLDIYQSVYIKPASGRFGKGVLKVEKTPDGYLFKDKTGIGKMAEDLDKVFELIERHRKKRKYIIQQAVSFIFQAKPVDFRVILQKDERQQWACSGFIARIGINGRIYTNHISSIDLGREVLQNIFGLSPEHALEKENEIVRICTEACLVVERAYGYFGDVGVDVVVDNNLKVWVLEINKSHQHSMAKLQRKDLEMYNRVVSRPLAYAKSLAGFG